MACFAVMNGNLVENLIEAPSFQVATEVAGENIRPVGDDESRPGVGWTWSEETLSWLIPGEELSRN